MCVYVYIYICISSICEYVPPDTRVESGEYKLPIRTVGFSNPSTSQTTDLKIDTCRYLAWCSALIGQDTD